MTKTCLLLLTLLFDICTCGAMVSCTSVEDGKQGEEGGGDDSPYWRSKLYPAGWAPGFMDSEGRFLHDFSYAGYHSSMRDIPSVSKNVIDVTQSPYGADRTGAADVRAVIQRAVDDVAASGGGVVYLPEGIYRVDMPDNASTGILVSSSGVVIRGDGTDKTFIKNTKYKVRGKTLISFRSPAGAWNAPVGAEVKLSRDVNLPTTSVPVVSTGAFTAGDMVVIAFDVTDGFREEHHALDYWADMTNGMQMVREVTAVRAGSVEIDVPTRYPLKLRDNARIYKIGAMISECGLENLSVGNAEHPAADGTGWDEEDWNIPGTPSYDVSNSCAIQFRQAYNCWIRNVSSYRLPENTRDYHVLSHGIKLNYVRFMTLRNCNMQKSQCEGGGGNGYLFTLQGANECLLEDCHAEHGRHNYEFAHMNTSGNVLLNCVGKDGYKASEFHLQLSVANLIDGFVADNDCLEANMRPYGTASAAHLYSATQCVIWNAKGIKPHPRGYLVASRQFGHGYVIGTSGNPSRVVSTPVSGSERGFDYDTAPEDWVEGVGEGATLRPVSLFVDQLKKRKTRNLQF